MKQVFKLLSIVCVWLLMYTNTAYAQLSPYDENAPVGWASIGLSGGCTGSNDQNPVVVTSEDELRDALKVVKGGKSSVTIYISGNIEVKEKLRYDKTANCTIYGLPGSSLYNRYHNENPDSAGFFSCSGWKNVIFRNLTLLGAGAYDISAMDNIQLSGCENIWIDHCNIQDGVDGNLDAKDKSDKITVSWCKFSYLRAPWPNEGESADHRCSSMWGSSNNRGDDEGKLNSTFVNCWWYHGCGQRCPRIRFGKVHIANCLWENGTDDDPAQYCVGVGHSSKLYIENGDFSNTVVSKNHLEYYLTEHNVYHFTVTGCIGEPDRQEKGKGYTGDFYNPYSDNEYKCRVYDSRMVASLLKDPQTGAGATLDEDLLTTRGNDNYGGSTTSIQGVSATDEASVVDIGYYDTSGIRHTTPQKGLNIIRFLMSDGTTRTQKMFK
ncbi:MAG: hypothetical protein J6Z41_07495 [Prevotella sp.]|nr:hypothetical protein [Prevotella sp.]